MNSHQSTPSAVQVTEADFQERVLKSQQPVLVDFWAPWSRPCQILEPVLNELASAWAGRAKVVKVNADDSLDLSLLYGIQSVPTLLYFAGGEVRDQTVGVLSKRAIVAKLGKLTVPA